MRARRIMIDAVDALLHLYDNPLRERQELYMLHEWLLDRGLTAIMTVKLSRRERFLPGMHFWTSWRIV